MRALVAPSILSADFNNLGKDIELINQSEADYIQLIKSFGAKASVCLNPHTPVAVLEDIIGDLDMVLLMSVNPGFGGQDFIENTYKKVAQLREMIDNKNADCKIEIDGGVNYETGKKLLDKGADVLVAGSFVFSAGNPKEIISGLKSL